METTIKLLENMIKHLKQKKKDWTVVREKSQKVVTLCLEQNDLYFKYTLRWTVICLGHRYVCIFSMSDCIQQDCHAISFNCFFMFYCHLLVYNQNVKKVNRWWLVASLQFNIKHNIRKKKYLALFRLYYLLNKLVIFIPENEMVTCLISRC